MAVGMAMAEKHLAAVYNQPGYEIVNHYTYALCGDGDLMEGISHEAASLAGTLGLGKLIVLYDDNLISLDGPTELSFTENVLRSASRPTTGTCSACTDGNDLNAIEAAIEAAKAETEQALAHRRPHRHRLRQPQGRHQQGARRSHGRRRRRRHQEILRLP